MTLQVSDRFQELALQRGVKAMLTNSYFDITKLDTLLKATHREEHVSPDTYALLRGLHCVNWTVMGPELAAETRAVCCAALGIQCMVEDVTPTTGADKFEVAVTESIARRIYKAFS